MRFVEKLRQRLRELLAPARAPEPDIEVTPLYPGETVVELQYSPRRYHRAIITQDAQGHFRVHRQQWDACDWQVGGTPYWAHTDSVATITDTLERARALAREALRETADG